MNEDPKKFTLTTQLMLGPFFFAAALVALLLKSSSLSVWAAFLSLFGLFVSWRFGKKGLMGSSFLLICTLGVWILKKELSFWDVQLSLSFVLSWVISAFSVERAQKKITALLTPIQEAKKSESFAKPWSDPFEHKLKELTQENISLRSELLEKDEELLFVQKELERSQREHKESEELLTENKRLETMIVDLLQTKKSRYTRMKPRPSSKPKKEENSLF